jgi:hypothetical protein
LRRPNLETAVAVVEVNVGAATWQKIHGGFIEC